MSRNLYLVTILGRGDAPFTPNEIAKSVQLKGNIVRTWLSRDFVRGYVGRTPTKKYHVIDRDAVVAEVERNKRNSATGGSTPGSTPHAPRTPQLCRLHDLQYSARLPNETQETLAQKLHGWEESAPASGSRHWYKRNLPIPELGANCTYHIACGVRATLQLWVQPVFCNSYKIFDQLEGTHKAAQAALRQIAQVYRIEVALLEVLRSGHFAIAIPIKEGYRLANLGYAMRGGKVWVNGNWWIDTSYGKELETNNEVAFKELFNNMELVGGMGQKLDMMMRDIHDIKVNGNGNGNMQYVPVPNVGRTNQEVA